MLTQVQYDRQKRRAKRRSAKVRTAKKRFRATGEFMRLAVDETPRTLWHPENW